MFNKTGKLISSAEAEQSFNTYMVLRAISMYDDPCDDALPIAAMFDKYQAILTKKQIYFGLVNTISKHKSGFKSFIKHKKDDENISYELVSNYFKCSQKEAAEYCEIMGLEWANSLKTKCGDFIEGDSDE